MAAASGRPSWGAAPAQGSSAKPSALHPNPVRVGSLRNRPVGARLASPASPRPARFASPSTHSHTRHVRSATWCSRASAPRVSPPEEDTLAMTTTPHLDANRPPPTRQSRPAPLFLMERTQLILQPLLVSAAHHAGQHVTARVLTAKVRVLTAKVRGLTAAVRTAPTRDYCRSRECRS
jgi:hypothetical protein